MKQILFNQNQLISCIFLVFLLTSCCDKEHCVNPSVHNTENNSQLLEGKYLTGEIFRPSTVDNPNGLIRIHFNEDDGAYKKLWVIPYSGHTNLGRFKKVYFVVNKVNDIFYADELTRSPPNADLLYKHDAQIFGKFINYHSGHSEKTQHRKIHVIGPKRTISGTPLVSMSTYQVNSAGNKVEGTEALQYFYESEINTLDLSIDYYSNIVGLVDTIKVSRLNINHIH